MVAIKLVKDKISFCQQRIKDFMFWVEGVFLKFKAFLVRLIQKKSR